MSETSKNRLAELAGGAENEEQAVYKAGIAARLTGLSPETLRVWERRYQVSGATRTERGHRLYTAEQVRRLGVLKQLVDMGHGIGALASMSLEQLQDLLLGSADAAGTQPAIRVAIIGRGLARRITASGLEGAALTVVAAGTQLGEAGLLQPSAPVDVLLVEESELHESSVADIVAAKAACEATAVVVLYRFCASATIRALRAQGYIAARVPAEMGELLALCATALATDGVPVPAALERQDVPQQRFDEETLSAIMPRNDGIACECPRHLADLLMMVGSFERYSGQCASRNEADARLHKDLEQAASQARFILEAALEKLMRSEGLWR